LFIGRGILTMFDDLSHERLPAASDGNAVIDDELVHARATSQFS
jgi:hypothetical protein